MSCHRADNENFTISLREKKHFCSMQSREKGNIFILSNMRAFMMKRDREEGNCCSAFIATGAKHLGGSDEFIMTNAAVRIPNKNI